MVLLGTEETHGLATVRVDPMRLDHQKVVLKSRREVPAQTGDVGHVNPKMGIIDGRPLAREIRRLGRGEADALALGPDISTP
eukprot:3348134-Alexandrium_andersonii.AAC.1